MFSDVFGGGGEVIERDQLIRDRVNLEMIIENLSCSTTPPFKDISTPLSTMTESLQNIQRRLGASARRHAKNMYGPFVTIIMLQQHSGLDLLPVVLSKMLG